VLEDFAPAAPERVLGLTAAQQLRDAMRGVVDKGTGVAIRSRYGISADVAGKTGTTQDNTDGWFILMHPQLVAGAWVGFNDGRITLRSDYWGQGAHSALPMVGEVFQQALRAKVIDTSERFIDEEESSWVGNAVAGVRNWVYDLFGRRTGGPDAPDSGAVDRTGEITDSAPPRRPRRSGAARDHRGSPLVPLENAVFVETPLEAQPDCFAARHLRRRAGGRLAPRWRLCRSAGVVRWATTPPPRSRSRSRSVQPAGGRQCSRRRGHHPGAARRRGAWAPRRGGR
jgi:penicillin-binding protein 1A